MENLTYKGEVQGCKYYEDVYGIYYLFVSNANLYYNHDILSPILSIVINKIEGFKGDFWELEYNIL